MRNKKRPLPEPTPEEIALERQVEAMMNPRPGKTEIAATSSTPELAVAKNTPAKVSANAPLDFFKGLPAEKVPLGVVKTAPVIPGKPVPKSLFNSVDSIKRSAPEAAPITVAIKPKLSAPLGTPTNATGPKAPVLPAMMPKSVSLGSNPTTSLAGGSASAVTVDSLARREEFSDAATDSAVADIMSKEGDDLLAAEDRARSQSSAPVFKQPERAAKWRELLTSKWLLLVIPAILIILAAVPYTRYSIASAFIKKSLVITVIDSKTTKPVSGALVSFKGLTAKTNTTGQAALTVPLGDGAVSISKGYYQAYNHKQTVGFGGAGSQLTVNLVATGRQVPITVINKITKQPQPGVTVKILGTSATTDKNGKLIIVLPTRTATATATLSGAGFKTTSAEVQITDSVVPANSLTVVPAGNVYFLSQASGTTDVVKASLDGSDRHTVLAGTGHEDADTSLIASRDWRYVVLKSHRDATQSGLYLIDTDTDKVTQFDNSTAVYTPIGWSGHSFLYDVVRTAQPQSQAGRESLKSYNADQQQLNQLDQSQAVGTATSYGYQSFYNFFIVGSQLVYNTTWTTGGSDAAYDLISQNASIRTVSAAGTGKKDLQTYGAKGLTSVQVVHSLPATIDYAITSSTDTTVSYYAYSNGSVSVDSSLTPATFAKTYPLYLASPDGTKTFWNDDLAGRQNLILGDKNAGNPNPLGKAGDYVAYGWYGSQYLLLSRAGSGLYVVPSASLSSNGAPVKIANYYQPSTAPNGYGGGF